MNLKLFYRNLVKGFKEFNCKRGDIKGLEVRKIM